MRCWAISVVLSSTLGCYVGPVDSGDDAPSEDSSGGGATAGDTDSNSSPTSPTDPSGASDPTATSDPSSDAGSAETSDPPPGDGSTDDGPADTGESSDDGPMAGCETGPLPAPIPGCAPAPMSSSGDIYQDCVDRINQFRWECQCLPPLQRWSDAETCSDDQSSADQNGGGPHANFGQCGENAQNTCPDWPSEDSIITGCLQSMWDEGPGEPFSEHGHYINMSSMAYTRVACGFSSSGGGVWSNQNFSP
jgi:hypothetical protein